MFERTEIAGKVYKLGTTYTTNNREEANRASHVRKCKEGESTSPTNPGKGHAGKRREKLCRPSKRSADW